MMEEITCPFCGNKQYVKCDVYGKEMVECCRECTVDFIFVLKKAYD